MTRQCRSTAGVVVKTLPSTTSSTPSSLSRRLSWAQQSWQWWWCSKGLQSKITNEQRLGIVYPAWWRGALLSGWQNGQGGFTSGGTIIPIIFSWFFMLEIMLISANAKLNRIPVKPVSLKGASNWLQIQERSRSSSPSSAPSSWCSSSFWSDGVHRWLCLGATADEQHQERIIQPGYHCRQAFSQVYMHQNSGAFYNPNMLYYKSRPTL